MAGVINGKTINQLVQIEDITGEEIIPLSIMNEETGKYVTRSITLNNMLKLIVGAIRNTNNRLSEAENNLNDKIITTASELNTALSSKIDESNIKFSEDIEGLKAEDIKINKELGYTVAYTSYNSSAIMCLDTYVHNLANDTSSYVTDLSDALAELSSYTHTSFAQNDKVDKQQQVEISTNTQLNSYQQINIDELKDIHANPWEITE